MYTEAGAEERRQQRKCLLTARHPARVVYRGGQLVTVGWLGMCLAAGRWHAGPHIAVVPTGCAWQPATLKGE